jgi:hypothetical protein
VPASWVDHAVLAVALAAAVVLWRRERSLLHPGWGRAILLALPMILLVTAMAPSQWDDFDHWLPNARYLFEVGGFPSRAGPPSPSFLPAYPYGLAVPIAHASVLVDRFAENAGAIFNVVLSIAFALLIARLIPLGAGRDGDGARGPGWGLTALALLSVTVLSPTFVPKIVFTSYPDAATSICVAFAAVLLMLMLGALGDGDERRARALAWQTGLVLAVLIALKQVDVILCGAILVGAALAAWRDPRVGLGRIIRLALPLLALPAVLYVAWRVYVAIEMPGGELSVRPMSTWFISLIPQILAQMLSVLSKKGGYFALSLIAIVLATRALRRTETPLDRLALIAACTFLGYNAFLFVCYVTVFGDNDALTVGSFWRYNMHVGGVMLALAALGGGVLWRRWSGRRLPLRTLGGIAIALMVAWPVVGSSKLRFDIRAPKQYVRAVAAEIRTMLKPGDLLADIDASGYGTYVRIMRYELLDRPAKVEFFERSPDMETRELSGFLATTRPSYAWVHVPTAAIEAAFGLKLPPRASTLLRREDGGWRVVKSWPYPGYDLPDDAK